MATPIVLWIIERFINNATKKEEAKKRYFGYVDYWKTNRVTPRKHGDDLKNIVENDSQN